MRVYVAAWALIAGIVAAPPLSAKAPQSLTAAEQAQLQQNLDRGALLYRYDQSAWHVTDAALAALPDSTKTMLRGYITTPAPKGLKTTFFGQSDDGRYFAGYSAVWTGSAIVDARIYPTDPRVPVTADEQRLIEARKVALDGMGKLAMCSSASPNVIVVPGGANEPVAVYILTPQTKNGVYPLGGHHRIDVKDGKIVATRDFTKSCIDLNRNAMPKGAQPLAAFITHLLDPVPTEIHAFSAFAMGVPLVVGVRDGRIYAVEIRDGRPQARLMPDKH